MSKPRKTVSVKSVVDRCNHMLEFSHDDQVQAREGVASFTEAVLMEANAYKGFRYLGTIWNPDGTLVTIGDESRRVYYLASELQS